ncbi:MAG: tRNA (N6-isopentenyl adenosine(37)-C2)-methylthiotransferase MiaB [Desulfobulbaceae bacterium]|nr:tRNA (N6-isopentenyl adenosine(37)-C2)-methylthiotransferase MiaB [Desulfobulbaceae bacterium]
MAKVVHIKTFGCQMNERDSEIMGQLLSQNGYVYSDMPEAADLILVNTCSIRDKAEQKVYSLLGQLRELKEKNRHFRQIRIGVCGCVAQQEGRKIIERMPHVDLVLGTQQLYQLPALLDQLEKGELHHKVALDLDANFAIPPFQQLLRETPTQKSSAVARPVQRYVNIMQGCNNFCSYCVVPYTRGREISRPLADILEEVELLVAQGVREITLLGQNVNSYGKTNRVADQAITFPDLLRAVALVQGLKRLRFTTSHPKDLDRGLIRCFAELEVLCPHFHLPVQSGSNQVLARMNRGYSAEEYLAKVEELRRMRPDIALATDFIVGFPGESEQDFVATIQLLQDVRFHSSFSFKYSDRPQARSTGFADKIAEDIKSERLARLQQKQTEISLAWNIMLMHKKVEILVEHISAQTGRGRSAANQVVHFQLQPGRSMPAVGDITHVLIEHAGPHSLRGIAQ